MFTLFSDPHIGTHRKLHATPQSSKALNQKIFQQAQTIAKCAGGTVVCLGDLFDKTNNDETTLLQGRAVARYVDFILAGNHDVANREGVVSTLHALAEMADDDRGIYEDAGGAPSQYIMPPQSVGGSHYVVEHTLDATHFFVPHHASQEAFIRTLHEVLDAASDTVWHCYLYLHCNVNFTLAEDNDAVLNLPDEMTEQLLEQFARIFVGHEHNSYTRFEDRLVVVGNTFPTSFSDVSDKFIWKLDDANNVLEREQVWSKNESYLEIVYGTDLSTIENPERYQFIEVIGRETVGTGVEVSKYMHEVRKVFSNVLLARQNVELVDVLDRVDTSEKPELVDLSVRIADDLKGSDLADLWDELSREAEQ